MRTICLRALTVLSVLVVSDPGLAAESHLHRSNGTLIDLQMSDSLVSLMFAGAGVDSLTFAEERPELRDDFPIRNLGGGLYIFGVDSGLDIMTAMEQLRTDTLVRTVNPVLISGETGEQWMTDELIVQFRDGVATYLIDSINQVLSDSVCSQDDDDPGYYLVTARSALHLSALDVSNLYYATGLCEYAQPNFLLKPALYGLSASAGGLRCPPTPSTRFSGI